METIDKGDMNVNGFFEYLCDMGLNANENFDNLEMQFLKDNKEKVYESIISWPEFIKERMNILLLLGMFGKIGSKEFEEKKKKIIECANSSQSYLCSSECISSIFTEEEWEEVLKSFYENSKLALSLQPLNILYVRENIQNKGFKTDYLAFRDEFDKAREEFNVFIDEIYSSPLDKDIAYELDDFIKRINSLHKKGMSIVNICDNYLYSNRCDDVKISGDYSLESLATMVSSTDFSKERIGKILTDMIKYSNYSDPTELDMARHYKKFFGETHLSYVCLLLFLLVQSTVIYTISSIINDLGDFKLPNSLIAVITAVSTTPAIYNTLKSTDENMHDLFYREAIHTWFKDAIKAASIQSGKSILNIKIKELKLPNNKR